MNKKRKILFIVDKPNWAYHFIVKTWAELLTNFDCYIAFGKDYQIRPKRFSTFDIFKNKVSSILQYREVQFRIDSSKRFSYPVHKTPPVYKVSNNTKVNITHFDIIIEMAYYLQYTSEFPFTSDKKLIGIYTDSFPHDGPSFDYKRNQELKELSREEFYYTYLKPYDGIVVGNYNLYNDYKALTSKIVVASGIYLQNDFIENHNVGTKESLTIGWTGTPDRPMKGFRDFIEPAIKEVQKTGRNINLKTKFSGAYEDLLSFYKDVDLIVIASSADTGPSLFKEASLCNVPCISTNIGFPKMIIQHNVNGMIVERDITAFKNAIIELYDNREKLIQFSKRIKKDFVEKMSNEISIRNLTKFLNNI